VVGVTGRLASPAVAGPVGVVVRWPFLARSLAGRFEAFGSGPAFHAATHYRPLWRFYTRSLKADLLHQVQGSALL
jgi:hypothetical protein